MGFHVFNSCPNMKLWHHVLHGEIQLSSKLFVWGKMRTYLYKKKDYFSFAMCSLQERMKNKYYIYRKVKKKIFFYNFVSFILSQLLLILTQALSSLNIAVP